MVDARWDLIHKKGIKPDVKADYPDVAYLTAIDTTKTYQVGQNSKQIKNLQQMLVFLGYDLMKNRVTLMNKLSKLSKNIKQITA